MLLITDDPTVRIGIKMEKIATLSIDEHTRYAEAYECVHHVAVGGIFNYFLTSVRALRDRLADANLAFADPEFKPQTNAYAVSQCFTDIRSAVLSVVSALSYHQEQCHQLASELHASDERVRAAVKQEFNVLYDAHREYRLLYALRNLLIHESMSVVTVSARPLLVRGRVDTRFDLGIDRSIANSSKKISPTARAEFAAITTNPDVLDLIRRLVKPLCELDQRVTELIRPDLHRSCRDVLNFDAMFEGKIGTRALVSNWEPGSPGQKPTCAPWLPQVFDYSARLLS